MIAIHLHDHPRNLQNPSLVVIMGPLKMPDLAVPKHDMQRQLQDQARLVPALVSIYRSNKISEFAPFQDRGIAALASLRQGRAGHGAGAG